MRGGRLAPGEGAEGAGGPPRAGWGSQRGAAVAGGPRGGRECAQQAAPLPRGHTPGGMRARARVNCEPGGRRVRPAGGVECCALACRPPGAPCDVPRRTRRSHRRCGHCACAACQQGRWLSGTAPAPDFAPAGPQSRQPPLTRPRSRGAQRPRRRGRERGRKAGVAQPCGQRAGPRAVAARTTTMLRGPRSRVWTPTVLHPVWVSARFTPPCPGCRLGRIAAARCARATRRGQAMGVQAGAGAPCAKVGRARRRHSPHNSPNAAPGAQPSQETGPSSQHRINNTGRPARSLQIGHG